MQQLKVNSLHTSSMSRLFVANNNGMSYPHLLIQDRLKSTREEQSKVHLLLYAPCAPPSESNLSNIAVL